MLHIVWFGMVAFSVIFSAFQGNLSQLFTSALSAAEGAISLTLRLAAGYAFFCGWMEIAKALHVPNRLQRCLSPLLAKLFPDVRSADAREAIVMNLTANVLGLGNAATPMGLRAMEQLAKEHPLSDRPTDAMQLFLVINATSIQLIPTTILALRVSAGSAAPSAILLPTLVCTAVSTIVGILSAKFCAKVNRHALD